MAPSKRNVSQSNTSDLLLYVTSNIRFSMAYSRIQAMIYEHTSTYEAVQNTLINSKRH